MKLLFTAPRFHTNQAPIVRGLIEKGHEVGYFVVFVGATEDHSCCEPLVLKPSRTTIREKKMLAKTKSASEVESAISGSFIPDMPFLREAFEAYAPDVVICREKTNLTLCVKMLCDEHHIPCVLYDQLPRFRQKENRNPSSAQAQKRSIWRRVRIKLERKLNPDLRLLMKLRASTGFPPVHMTPVQYTRLPRSLSEEKADEKAYFIPFVAEERPKAENRPYCPKGKRRILCVGKYREYKNVKLLIEAASRLDASQNWHITVVGQVASEDEKEYYRQTVELVEGFGLTDRITLICNVPHKQIGSYYLENDLFVLPTKREHASIAVLEAMSYGLAVLSTDNNGTASYVEDAGCGTTFETENAEDLAKKLQKMLDAELAPLGRNAADWVRHNCCFDSYEAALGTMLQEEFGLHI